MRAGNQLEQLALLLQEGRMVLPNTTSAVKAAQLQALITHLVGADHQVGANHDDVSHLVLIIQQILSNFTETDLPDSRIAAQQKARDLRAGLFRATGEKHTTAGADTAFRLWVGGEQWVNMSKLERLGRVLTLAEIQQIHDWLKMQLVDEPRKTGIFKCAWEVSLHIENGVSGTVTELLLFRCQPIPEEVFQQYFWDAVNTGFIYKSNSWMKLIELIVNSGIQYQVAVVDYQIWQSGEDVRPLFMNSDQALGKRLIDDVVGTMPVAALVLPQRVACY